MSAAPAKRAKPLLALVAEHAAQSQVTRRPADAVVRAFADKGLLQIMAPRTYGGEEARGLDLLELVETVATVDGSAAWVVMTLNEEMGIACTRLSASLMTEVVSTSRPVVVAGAGAPRGTAVKVDGGWRLNGDWPFVTGGPAADRIVVGAFVSGGAPRELCYVLVPREQATVADNWDTIGLRGTGSHDVELHDVFVPDAHVGLTDDPAGAVADGPLYRLPTGLRFPFPKVGVACGIATAALRSFAQLAETKRARLARTTLRDQPDAQLAMAEARALIGTGRAFAVEMLETVWDLAEAGDPIPADVHAVTRLACSTAVANCVRAVEGLATAAGTTANVTGHPLQRQLADVRAVPQHFMVGGHHRLSAGRVLLGLESEDPYF